MRPRAASLNALAIALAAALAATLIGTSAHARAADRAPVPVVIAIDPGHGGLPSLTDPTQPFDPGAIGPNGVMEKDVTLDVANKLAALLQLDLVHPVLTRTGDTWVTIADREQVAINSGASLFLSVHCNSFTDATSSGSLVLYPNAQGMAFAQTLSDTLARALSDDRIPDDGIQLRDNWWTHAPMPTSTAEIAYLSNRREAALLASDSFRERVALALRDAIERYDPHIASQKAAILAWRAAHSATPTPSPAPSPSASAAHAAPASAPGGGPNLLLWAALVALAAAGVRWRRGLVGVVAALLALTPLILNRRALHRAAARRRRRRLRARSLLEPYDSRPQRRSVYDDLSF